MTAPVRGPIALLSSLLALAASLLVAAPAAAQSGTAQPGAESDPIRGFVARQVNPGAGRVEIAVGQLDPRLQLAPCARIEPYLLPGTRLWGRTSIGVRCVEGATWNVSLPITVSVRGVALVAAEPLAAGATPGATAFRLEEVELTKEPGAPVTDLSQLVGRSLTRGLAAGQVLRQDHLRATPTVAAGDPVRIRLVGQGFSIQADGQALAPAAEGQPVRVRTENGRIVAGTLRGRTVEVGI